MSFGTVIINEQASSKFWFTLTRETNSRMDRTTFPFSERDERTSGPRANPAGPRWTPL